MSTIKLSERVWTPSDIPTTSFIFPYKWAVWPVVAEFNKDWTIVGRLFGATRFNRPLHLPEIQSVWTFNVIDPAPGHVFLSTTSFCVLFKHTRIKGDRNYSGFLVDRAFFDE